MPSGDRDLGDMLCSILLGKDEEDWDLLLPGHPLISRRVKPQTSERERETRLPEHLMYGPAASGNSSRESYAAELANRMEAAYDKLEHNSCS